MNGRGRDAKTGQFCAIYPRNRQALTLKSPARTDGDVVKILIQEDLKWWRRRESNLKFARSINS